MSYRIKTVAERTGIPRNTIVAWERRYGVVKPVRAPNGYRVYSDADVARLQQVKLLLDRGFKISEAIQLLDRPDPLDTPAAPPPDALRSAMEELLERLLAFDRPGADRLRAGFSTLPYRAVIDDLLSPLVRHVGHGWERGTCTVAQEHFATAWVRDQLSTMLLQLGGGPPGGHRVACATPPGERHELGLLGLGVKLALHGNRVIYLGPDLPLEALGAAVVTQGIDTVLLSIVNRTDAGSLRELADDVRAVIGESPRLVLGGPGVPEDIELGCPGVITTSVPEEVLQG